MDDEEEMKTQCFGGDYMGEVCKFYSLKSPNKLDVKLNINITTLYLYNLLCLLFYGEQR